MTGPGSSLPALLRTIRVQMVLSMARPMFQFIILIQPFFLSTIAVLVYGSTSESRLLNYVVLGSGFTTLWSSVVFSSASDVNRERYYGTLESIFTAPVSFAVVLVGKIVGNTLLGLLSMAISLIYLVTVYHIHIPITHPWLLLVAFLCVFGSLTLFAFFLAMAFTLSRQAEALMNFVEFPIYVVCGFLFPITILPVWLHPLSWILNPTWCVNLLRLTLESRIDPRALLNTYLILIAIDVAYLLTGIVCYRKMDYKARVTGKLGVY